MVLGNGAQNTESLKGKSLKLCNVEIYAFSIILIQGLVIKIKIQSNSVEREWFEYIQISDCIYLL